MRLFLYKYLGNNDEVLYVGQAKNWKTRLYQHNNEDKNMMREVLQIFIMNCQDKLEMDILEKFYIQVYSPKLNKKDIGYEIPSIIPVHKKWEYASYRNTYIVPNCKEIYDISNEQIDKLLHLEFLTKEFIWKIIVGIKNGWTMNDVYARLMFENCNGSTMNVWMR